MWLSWTVGTLLSLGQTAPLELPREEPGVVEISNSADKIPQSATDDRSAITPVMQLLQERQVNAVQEKPKELLIEAPIQPVTPIPPAEPAPAAPAPPDRWWLMQQLQGNWLGSYLDANRTSISGWIEQSFNGSTARVTNQPVVWDDRPNQYMLNQFWIRLERSTVTSGTTQPTFGYRVDVSSGTDYRFSLMRGLFDSQLANSEVDGSGNPKQNVYGVDPIQFYTNAYLPNLFNGTDIRVGRLFTPWGFESLEGISTPFVSRSYAFNWSPPFTHMGIMVSPTFNNQWSGKFMLANGNDVFFTSNQEIRSVGAITWTALDKQDIVTFGWTLGRGKFNAGAPYAPATAGEQYEPAGRNNINVLDLVYTHNFTSVLQYNLEALYGWQTGVPANISGGIISNNDNAGTARWASLANYLYYTIDPQLVSITRLEFFDDFNGQRTGFEGFYTALTTGFQYRPTKPLMLRPEIRYDYNTQQRPFDGKHGILTAAIDVILRF
jgi:hypothetical protein